MSEAFERIYRFQYSPDLVEPTADCEFIDWRVSHAAERFREKINVILGAKNPFAYMESKPMDLSRTGMLMMRDVLSNHAFILFNPTYDENDTARLLEEFGFPPQTVIGVPKRKRSQSRFDFKAIGFSPGSDEDRVRVDF